MKYIVEQDFISDQVFGTRKLLQYQTILAVVGQ